MERSGSEEGARELLLRYLRGLADAGETEIYLSPDSVRNLHRALAPTDGRERPVAPRAPEPARRAAPAPPTTAVKHDIPELEVVEVELVLGTATGSPDMFTEASPLDGVTSLEDVERIAAGCEKCELARGRTKVVFGVGNTRAALMFIGEAPGHDEDLSGIPFVGRAGQLLDKILEAAGIRRDDVYIGNIIKCRPPNNRTPLTTEIDACMPYLAKQIQYVSPKIICTLGLPATQTLLGLKGAMASLRGKVYKCREMRIIPTYHPAAALRDPKYKRPIWEDFLIVKREYERL
jgi:uracil-DNA glycosylase family 4